MATVKDFIKCPKCGKQMMGKAHPQKFGKEYFAHCCHQYFGVNELVNQWNYDAADLTPIYPVTHANYKVWIPKGSYPYMVDVEKYPNKSMWNVARSEFDGGEPIWETLTEYADAQKMVGRMFLGIPELDDYTDLLATQEDALEIGVQ